MTTLDRVHAIANDVVNKFNCVPHKLTAKNVISTLQSLGFMIPTKLAAAAATSDRLSSPDYRFPLREVDAALSKANVPITDRFRLKEAMDRNGILGK